MCGFVFQVSPEWPGEHYSLCVGRPALRSHWTWAVDCSASLPRVCRLSDLPHHRIRWCSASTQQGSVVVDGHCGHFLHGLQGAQHSALHLEMMMTSFCTSSHSYMGAASFRKQLPNAELTIGINDFVLSIFLSKPLIKSWKSTLQPHLDWFLCFCSICWFICWRSVTLHLSGEVTSFRAQISPLRRGR